MYLYVHDHYDRLIALFPLFFGHSRRGMFYEAASFNPSNLGQWDVSSVEVLESMFQFASSFNDESIGEWDVSAVVNLGSMFSNAASFNVDISNWDTSKVETM